MSYIQDSGKTVLSTMIFRYDDEPVGPYKPVNKPVHVYCIKKHYILKHNDIVECRAQTKMDQ